MPNYDDHISELLAVMDPISLDEMSGIKLMNRIDTKFVASKRQLVDMLRLVRDKYFVQEINSDRISPYRTTYFDTDNYAQYMQHHGGRATRTKVRVRTYLSSGDPCARRRSASKWKVWKRQPRRKVPASWFLIVHTCIWRTCTPSCRTTSIASRS